jgi:PiT family inorganic phosphate transporter
MTELAASTHAAGRRLPNLDAGFAPTTLLMFLAVSFAGMLVIAFGLYGDISQSVLPEGLTPFVLLGIALTIALGFEFVNGFHDTANAAATVIYTHALPPNAAVVWSGFWNFLGVLFSTGAVAFGIVALLPVELILEASTGAGFAMVFALLLAAIAWNLGTWYLGLPVSSSHALIGSIMGVGLVNQLMHAQDSYSGIDWSQVQRVGWSLLISPLVGFCCAALLVMIGRHFIRNPELYKEPAGKPPPWWIRIVLILTCTGVSFAHGSNDGQKGMGLIMLILIGTVPTAYALNRSMPDDNVTQFTSAAAEVQKAIGQIGTGTTAIQNPQKILTDYLSSGELTDETLMSLSMIAGNLAEEVASYGTFRKIPAEAVYNVRNDMYLASKSISLISKSQVPAVEQNVLSVMNQFKLQLEQATQFIPTWVKVAVAIALGLGTMVGWKRVVVTVGERIGKSHLTYAQGGSAEVVAMATIFAADAGGLPVSTTHVLSSGVAGAMAASGSGLQWATVRNLAAAWILTLPAAIMISGALYFMFYQVF